MYTIYSNFASIPSGSVGSMLTMMSHVRGFSSS